MELSEELLTELFSEEVLTFDEESSFELLLSLGLLLAEETLLSVDEVFIEEELSLVCEFSFEELVVEEETLLEVLFEEVIKSEEVFDDVTEETLEESFSLLGGASIITHCE